MKKVYIVIFGVILVIASILIFLYLGKNDNIEDNTKVDTYSDVDIYDVGVDVDVYEEKNVPVISSKEVKPISYEATVPIFMYHWVRDEIGDYPWPENMVSPSLLEEQIKYLSENGYDFVYARDLEKIYNYKKPVALTFDDGWLDVYLYAFPMAKKYNAKISMFVIKDKVGEEGYCTEEQLKEMANSGFVDIESHTLTHPHLSEIDYDSQKKELKESRDYLKDVYGVDAKVICYPYGDRNDDTVKIAKEVGYTIGLDMDGVIYNSNTYTDIFKIPRIFANRSMTMDEFTSYVLSAKVDVKWEE